MPLDQCLIVDDYIENELDDVQRGEFELHLDVCSTCREQVSLANQLDDLIESAWRSIETPDRLLEAAQVNLAPHRNKVRRWMAGILTTSAALVMIVGLAAFFNSQGVVETVTLPAAKLGQETETAGDKPPALKLTKKRLVTFYQGSEGASLIVPSVTHHPEFTIVRAFSETKIFGPKRGTQYE